MTTAYLLNHPAHVEHVLQTNYRNYNTCAMMERLKPVFGNGLVTSDDEVWARQRKLMQPSFHTKKIEALAEPMSGVVVSHLEHWHRRARRGEEFNLSEDIARLSLEVVLRTMFGSGLGDEKRQLSRALVLGNEVTSRRVWDLTPLSSVLPTGKNREFERAVEFLQRIVGGIVADRRRSGVYGTDLLGILLEASSGGSQETMSNEQLRDEAITLMLAGYESTATMVAWAIFFLSQHPAHLERMRAEVDVVLQGRTPQAADLTGLEYTRRVIQEVGRLRPSIWWFARAALADDNIGGQQIKAGTMVFISQYLLHTLPSVWEDPERFDPDRFLPENVAQRSRYSYLPFGVGPRVCIGSSFAMVEMQLILPMVFRAFDVRITSDENPDFGNYMSLRPNKDFTARASIRVRH